MIDALAELPGRLPDQPVEVLFEAFGDSSIDALVLIWLSAADEMHYKRCRSEAIVVIDRAFDANGFTIPLPIRTLDFGASTVGGQRLDAMEWCGNVPK
jgi:small conductance mechanosensitive channel